MELSTAGRFVRRPVISIVVYFVIGTWVGLNCEIPIVPLLAAAAACCLGAAVSVITGAPRWFAAIFLAGTIFLAACCSSTLSQHDDDDVWLGNLHARDGDRIVVTGVVCGDPDVLPAAADPRRGAAQFPLQVDEIKCNGVRYPAEQKMTQVRCYGNTACDIPLYGERWRIDGKLSYAKKIAGQVSGRNNHWIRASFRDSQFISGGQGCWLAERCYSTRRAAAGYLSAGLADHRQTVDVLQSLILGYRRLSYDMRQVFVFTGTLHIFAISGSHVVIMGAILIVVLGMFKVSSVHWGLFLGPLLCLYTFATGMQSSAVRACIMAIIYWGAPLMGRKADGLTALFGSVLLIVAAVPTQLYDTGFILSVVCVLGLIIIYPLIHDPIQKKLEPDPLRLQPEEKWKTWLRTAAKGLWSMVAMSISAWLVSAPLTAYFFGNFTPMGIVANLIVIPLSELVITAGCLSLVTGACVGWVGEVFNHANIVLVWLMVNPMEWLAKIPYGNVKIENVPLWSLAVWYGLLVGWVVWVNGNNISELRLPNADCRKTEEHADPPT